MTNGAGQDPPGTGTILELRISTIWSQTTLDIFSAKADPGANAKPGAAIGDEAGYIRAFEAARKGISPLTVPWPRPKGQKMWQRYLGGTDGGNVTASAAWNALVPLRWAARPRPTDTTGAFRLFAEAFVVPGGYAVALTADAIGPLTMAEAANEAIALRVAPRRVQVASDPPMNWDTAGSTCVDIVRQSVLGLAGAAGPAPEAFTVATFITTRDVDPAISTSNDARLALDGIALANLNWRTATVQPPESTDLALSKSRRPPVSHILYATNRARVVWYPQKAQTVGLESLGCYHRNLVLLSAQDEIAVVAAQ